MLDPKIEFETVQVGQVQTLVFETRATLATAKEHVRGVLSISVEVVLGQKETPVSAKAEFFIYDEESGQYVLSSFSEEFLLNLSKIIFLKKETRDIFQEVIDLLKEETLSEERVGLLVYLYEKHVVNNYYLIFDTGNQEYLPQYTSPTLNNVVQWASEYCFNALLTLSSEFLEEEIRSMSDIQLLTYFGWEIRRITKNNWFQIPFPIRQQLGGVAHD